MDGPRIERRTFLAVSALGAAGLAGCSSGAAEAEAGTPKSFTQEFYDTLYGEADLEAANEMRHPESPQPDLEPTGFRPYGGLENMDTEIRSMDVVSNADGRAKVTAEVRYTVPAGTADMTDILLLRKADGEWRLYEWYPDASSDSENESSDS